MMRNGLLIQECKYINNYTEYNHNKWGLPLKWKEHTFAVAMCDIAREAGINPGLSGSALLVGEK